MSLQRAAAEYLEGGCHLCDLIASSHLDPGLQIAAGHAEHPAGQHLEATQQYPTDEEPCNKQSAPNADSADSQQEGASGQDSLRRSLRRSLRVGAGRGHEPIDLANQVEGDFTVQREQVLLVLDEPEPLLQQIESVVAAFACAQLEQPGNERCDFFVQRRARERR